MRVIDISILETMHLPMEMEMFVSVGRRLQAGGSGRRGEGYKFQRLESVSSLPFRISRRDQNPEFEIKEHQTLFTQSHLA